MTETSTTEHIIESARPVLAPREKQMLWEAIDVSIPRQTSVLSPYFLHVLSRRSVVSIAFVVMLLVGSSSTMAASGTARPGDFLFPIDQAVEKARLALALNDTEHAVLQLQFALERIEELRSLLSEGEDLMELNSDSSVGSSLTSTTSLSHAEAHVYTDTTVVTVEQNDRKTTFETTARTRDDVIDEIQARFNTNRDEVSLMLAFDFEDRASRIGERIGEQRDSRVDESLELLEELLVQMNTEDRDRITTDVVTSFEKGGRFKYEKRSDSEDENDEERKGDDDDHEERESHDDNDEERIEMRDDDSQYRFREKDGEIRIEQRGNVYNFKIPASETSSNAEDERTHDEDEKEDKDVDERHVDSFEAKARVHDDTTIVTVKENGVTNVFDTTARTRSGVIDAIRKRFDVERSLINAVLDFEIETEEDEPQTTNNQAPSQNHKTENEDENGGPSDNDSGEENDHLKIEVEVKDGIARIQLEYNDEKDEFETPFTSESALIAFIVAQTGLSEASVSEALDLEIED